MKYIDSIHDIAPSEYLTYKSEDRLEIVMYARKIVATCHEYLDSLMGWRDRNLKQIDRLSNNQTPKAREFVDFMIHENKLYEITCQVMLYYADIMIAYKNMHMCDDDWEARVHIRRIYTLLFEILENFYGDTGKPIRYLNKNENSEGIKEYKSARKNLRQYLNANKSELEDIRNKTEAHKDSEISLQIDLIEKISIRKAFLIIENAKNRIDNVIYSMPPLFREYNSILNTLSESL